MNLYLDLIVFWLQRAGGISTYFHEIAHYAASRSDLTVQTIFPSFPCQNVYASWLKTLELHPDIQPLLFGRYRRAPTSRGLPGVFHSSYYRLPQSDRHAYVVTVYDFTYEHHRKGAARLVHCWQKYRAVRHADIVICISEYTKQDLLHFVPDIDANRVRVIPLAAGKQFRVLSGNKTSVTTCDGRPYALYVGDRRGYKRFDLAVASVALHTSLALVVVGSPLTRTEISLLDKHLLGRWYHAGHVNNEELNRLYNGAFLLLYPSEYEGFGIPVLEAMQAGCPVICFNRSALTDTAGDAALLVKKQSALDYAEAIAALDVAENREMIINRGLIHARGFTWETTCAKTIAAYYDAFRHKFNLAPEGPTPLGAV